MKNLIITAILTSVSGLSAFAQTQQAPSFILNQHLTGNQHYKASQFIEMGLAPGSTTGFEYNAQTSGGEFIAEIDPFMVFPPEEGAFGGPNSGDDGVVGSIAGVFDVSALGQATYTIPIQIPNDFKGMMPSLAISYTSQSSNGLLGIGWNLAGISSISRTGSTVYHDGLTKGIKFDETDNFILDGQRLMRVSVLPNGTNDCEYRTEQETFNRVFSKTPTVPLFLNGPESFVVQKKDGSKWYYGSKENSRMSQKTTGYISITTNYLWLLDRVEDIKGNYIEYNYTKYINSGEIYIDYIKYTGFTNADQSVNIAPNYEIKFKYEERLDKDFAFIRDIKLESNQILTKIIIKKQPENKELYTYVMDYVFDGKYNCLHNVSLTDEFGNSYNPLGFEWTKPETHPTSTETIITEIGESLLFSGDFNGDGFSDFLKLPKYTGSPYNSDQKMNLLLNNKNGGFVPGSFERNLSPNFHFIKVCDINGDLKSDFLYCESFDGYTFKITPYVYDNNGNFTIFNTIVFNNYISSASAFSVGDFLGLGKTGLLIKSAMQNEEQIVYSWEMYYYNDPWSNVMEKVGEGIIDNWGSINMEGDFNGDGKTDIMVVNELNTKIYSFEFNEDNVLTPVHFYNDGYPTVWHRVFTGDFNGDGRTDVLTYDIDESKWGIAYFKETGFDWPYHSVNIPGGDPGQYAENLEFLNLVTDITHLILDFDGNGKDDIVTFKYTPPIIIPPHYFPPFETHIDIAYMYPDKKVIYKTDKFVNQTRFLIKTTHIGDFYGKGKSDILITASLQYLRVYDEYGYWIVRNVTFPTILKSFDRKQYLIDGIDDGMDNIISVEYDKITSPEIYANSNYYGLVKGIYDITIPLNVVKRTIAEMVPSEELSHLKVNEFKYEGLKLHRKGKGLLGFTKLITSSNISNTINVKTNALNENNVFLYPLKSEIYFQQIQDGNLLAEQTSNFTRAVYHSNPRVYMLQLNSQLNHLYEEKGVFKKTELTKYTYDNLNSSSDPIYVYGNVTKVTQSLSKSKLWENHNDYDYKSETSYTYHDDVDYTDLWLVSLVVDTKTTQSSNEAGSVSIINKTTNTYYPKSNALGFPFIWKTIEKPNDDDNHLLSVEKVFLTFDARGNLLSSTISAPNYRPVIEPRSSSVAYSANYHHRFPTTTTNALGNTATSTYDPVYGTLKTSTGPNGLTTHYESNPMGTYSKTTSPDGIISTTVSRWAFGHAHAPKNAYYFTWQQTSGSPEVMVFYHKSGVELRSVTFGFDGSAIYVDKIYNDKSLLHKESLPHKKGEDPIYTEYLYDDYNRLETVTTPDGTTTTTAFAANQVTVTTKNGDITRTSTIKYNAAGWLTESTDNFGGIVKNEYYCNGNLEKSYIVGDPTQSATTISLEYDARGNRTLLNDPNYGPLATVYNAYGELVTQTNPRNEITSFTYDKLGRMTNESSQTEGNITWKYSTTPNRIGTLENVIKNNHRTNYVYDDFLRLTSETEIIDGASYTTQYTYDELGRPFTTTHPTGIKLRDGYNDYGYHNSITLENNSTQVWKTEDVNAIGLVTKFKTGNGLVTDQAYYPLTMRPYTVKTAKPGSNPIQDLEYGWYGLGNLEYRKKWLNRTSNTSLTESFTYDGLDRLININLNGISTGYHSYDNSPNIPNLGNISFKFSDGSTIFSNAIYGINANYYGPHPGPHAITEVTTANPILTGPRQDISYNGYDKVDTIIEGEHSLYIQYGHHRQRIAQQYSDGTNTIDKVWAGVCEYITKNGQQYKHTYLTGPMGVFAIHIIKPNGTEEINYIHADHLGSWNTITDENGNLLQEQSFDAWGNRRDPDTWRAFTSTPEEPLFDRGFTGHEHLYAFNLINMNGRFYDPIIGRMLSPDNFMQAPDYTQSFNRYSYCWNNPLKYTDPSGEFIWGVVAFITIGAYEMWKPGGWDGWKSSGQNSVNAGINGLLFGGNAPVIPTNLIKYSGSILANRFIADNINLSITSGNWTFSTTQGLGIGANGKLTYNFFGTIVFDDGETNFGFGFGKASNIFALGGHIRKSNGGGIGYYYTHYGNEKGYDGKSNKQNVAGFQFYWKGGSFRWENDVFAWQHQDKYRSNAMEFEIDGFVFGCSIYNNDPAGEGQKKEDPEVRGSRTFGLNQSKYSSWPNGQTYLAPFWIGFKMGNNITRFGYSHWLVQDLTQNFMHQQSLFKEGNQNYYLEYNNLDEGRWAYQGYYNPFSLYNH